MNEILKILEEKSSASSSKKYRKGVVLFYENNECTSVGVVKSGRIAIKSFLSSGKEVVYNELGKGEMFGNNLLFSSLPFYRGDVVAEEDSEIYLLNKDEFLSLMQNNQAFLNEYLRWQSDFSKLQNLRIKLLTMSKAEERLEYYLTINNGKIKIKSITELAKTLYLTRESLSRTIAEMSKSNQIKYANKTIVKI